MTDMIRRDDAIAAMAPMLRDMISRGKAADLIRALPAAPAHGWRVKGLEWTQNGESTWQCDGYTIFQHAPSWSVTSFKVHGANGYFAFRSTIDLAQAAAQADYDARIRAAMEPDTSPALGAAWMRERADGRYDALVTAIRPVADLVDISGSTFSRKYPELNAKLDKVGQERWGEVLADVVSKALIALEEHNG